MIAWGTPDDSYVNMGKPRGKAYPIQRILGGCGAFQSSGKILLCLPALARTNTCTRILVLQVPPRVAGAPMKTGKTVSFLTEVPLGTWPGVQRFSPAKTEPAFETREK